LKAPDWKSYNFCSDNHTLNFEAELLKIKCIAHEEYACMRNFKKIIDYRSIIYNNLIKGPSYGLNQKKTFDYSIRVWMSLTNIDVPEDINIFYFEDTIDEFYPPRHLILFMHIEDLSDVLDYSFEEPKITRKLQSLKDCMLNNIKEGVNLRFFDECDSIDLSTKTKSFNYFKNKKKDSNQLRYDKGMPNDIEDTQLKFLINHVSKSAEESRVIAIADIPTRNLLHICRESTTLINNNKYDKYGKPRWNFEGFLRTKKNKNFVLVDQKKSGWTFPMELMALYFECAEQKYPDYKYFTYLKEI